MDEHEQQFEVSRQHKGLSLSDFLDAVAGPLDRKLVVSAARSRQLLLNGEPAGAGATVMPGDLVEVDLPTESMARTPPRAPSLLHQDDVLVVADKPSGLAFGESRHGGLSAIAALKEQVTGVRPVHRLDKQTSGVVVAALGSTNERALIEDFRAGRAHVEYLAVVRSTLRETEGLIDVPLGKHKRSDSKLAADPDHGDACMTRWSVEEALRGFTVVRVVPQGGGRSHQVRAHLAAAGMTALCDRLYGEDDRMMLSQLKLDYRPKRGRPERPILARPALHAERFVRGDLVVTSPLPDELQVLLKQLRRLRPLT